MKEMMASGFSPCLVRAELGCHVPLGEPSVKGSIRLCPVEKDQVVTICK